MEKVWFMSPRRVLAVKLGIAIVVVSLIALGTLAFIPQETYDTPVTYTEGSGPPTEEDMARVREVLGRSMAEIAEGIVNKGQ